MKELIEEGKGVTPAQIALAWLPAQKPWIVPVPGSRKLERLEKNLGAPDIRFSEEELHVINDAIAIIPVQGDCC